jgi:hypothetical protein
MLPTLPGKTSATLPAKCSQKLAAARAMILMGCYRKTDANDPEVYVAAVVAVLTRYLPEVAIAVTEPATGLPSKAKWLPSIAELVEACNEARESRQSYVPPPKPVALLAPPVKRLSEAEKDAQFARLGLQHLRPGSRFVPPAREAAP